MDTTQSNVTYVFSFQDGSKITYSIRLDPISNTVSPRSTAGLPDWTRLEHKQCPECPLNRDVHPHCPVAANLYELADTFKSQKSFTPCQVQVETPQRNYSKAVTLQEGLGSIFGLIMAGSACPAMDFLKPMAHFHLPFANLEETIARSTSFYLLGQYFTFKSKKQPDLELKDLQARYHLLNKVNKHVAERIHSLKDKTGDAGNNAIVILDTLAILLTSEIKNDLHKLEYLFQSHVKKAA